MTLPAAIAVVECTTGSADATHALAASLAPFAEAGDLLCLWGELGAGKTVFAKGFGHGLEVVRRYEKGGHGLFNMKKKLPRP